MDVVVQNIGWNGGSISDATVSGDFELTFKFTSPVVGVVMGVNNLNGGEGYADIDHGLYTHISAGTLSVAPVENGVVGPVSALAVDDVLMVKRVGRSVSYKNGATTLYTSAVPSTGPVFADASLYYSGDSVTALALVSTSPTMAFNEMVIEPLVMRAGDAPYVIMDGAAPYLTMSASSAVVDALSNFRTASVSSITNDSTVSGASFAFQPLFTLTGGSNPQPVTTIQDGTLIGVSSGANGQVEYGFLFKRESDAVVVYAYGANGTLINVGSISYEAGQQPGFVSPDAYFAVELVGSSMIYTINGVRVATAPAQPTYTYAPAASVVYEAPALVPSYALGDMTMAPVQGGGADYEYVGTRQPMDMPLVTGYGMTVWDMKTLDSYEVVAVTPYGLDLCELVTDVIQQASVADSSALGRLFGFTAIGNATAVGTAITNNDTMAHVFDTVTVSVGISPRGDAEVWVMNATNGATSAYNNYDFNGMVYWRGAYYGTSELGLFSMRGATDNGQDIEASITTGLIDFNSPDKKRAQAVYVVGEGEGDIDLQVDTDENQSYVYNARLTEALHTTRVDIGRGLRGRYWQFKISNVGGSEFTIDELIVPVDKLGRKV